jgi:hypothetical protein
MRLVLVLTGFALAVVAFPASASAATCARFIVGEANSSAYPDFELPARGFTAGASCATLRRVARRLHDGTYTVPKNAAKTEDFGPPFQVRDGGISWKCRLWSKGGSGPTYDVVCSRAAARVMSWNAG